jgi:hypothetical protein
MNIDFNSNLIESWIKEIYIIRESTLNAMEEIKSKIPLDSSVKRFQKLKINFSFDLYPFLNRASPELSPSSLNPPASSPNLSVPNPGFLATNDLASSLDDTKINLGKKRKTRRETSSDKSTKHRKVENNILPKRGRGKAIINEEKKENEVVDNRRSKRVKATKLCKLV